MADKFSAIMVSIYPFRYNIRIYLWVNPLPQKIGKEEFKELIP